LDFDGLDYIEERQMKQFTYKKMEKYHISHMANLLYDRQKREINHFSFLENQVFDLSKIKSNLVYLFTQETILGYVAYLDNEMVAYLFARKIESRYHGMMAYVPYIGLAIKEETPIDVLRYLYKEASQLWLNNNCQYHSVFVPLADSKYKEAFFNLAFHIEQVHACLELDQYKPYEIKEATPIRVANKHDQFLLGQMSSIISDYQVQSPVYLSIDQDMKEQRRKAFENLVNEDDVIVLIAGEDNQGLGYFEFEYLNQSLMIPDQSIELTVAGVFKEYRNNNVGKTLMNASVKYLIDQGFKYLMTDWKVSNLAASRFWPKCKFVPIAYRMVREIKR
jgi:GNAT superfamily N-acetyltransferase